jgi:hypothetical protein
MNAASSFGLSVLGRRAAAAVLAVAVSFPLIGCVDVHRSPTVVAPQGAQVVCPGGRPAVYDDGAYRC